MHVDRCHHCIASWHEDRATRMHDESKSRVKAKSERHWIIRIRRQQKTKNDLENRAKYETSR